MEHGLNASSTRYARDESYGSKRIKGYIECSYNKEATQIAQAGEQSISFDGITGYARAQKTESEIVEKSYCSKGVRRELFT
jgi:hypothetical protein